MKCRCSNCGWLEVNPSGAMFCGYSGERTWEDESCLAWKDKDGLKTNANRIRFMTDEELADKFEEIQLKTAKAYGNDDLLLKGELKKYWLDWLSKEAN